MSNWDDVPDLTLQYAQDAALAAAALGPVFASLWPAKAAAAYQDARNGTLAFSGDESARKAASDVGLAVRAEPLTRTELEAHDHAWVRVAATPGLKSADDSADVLDEASLPPPANGPSPLGAMLAGGLLGSGAGLVGGWGLQKIAPEGWGSNLPRTGAALGGALGVVPGLAWWGVNRSSGKGVNESWPGGDEPPGVTDPKRKDDEEGALDAFWRDAGARTPSPGEEGGGISLLNLRRRIAVDRAVKRFGAIKGAADWLGASADVSVDALGRTLWDAEADPELSARALGTVYAAQQLPDPGAREGWATGGQLGMLARQAGGGYFRGLQAGAALNLLVGTPWRAPLYGATGATLGLISAILPKIFGG